MAAAATVASIASIAASVFSVGKSLTQKAPVAPAPTPLPIPPNPLDQASATEAALTRRSRGAKGYVPPVGPGAEASGRSATLLTGPGPSAAAPVAYKTLLGM